MIVLRPLPSKAVAPLLSSAIAARQAQQFLDQRTTGMAESQVNFENDALLNTPIVLPAIDEQIAIAKILSDMDDEITALEAETNKARAIKQGMMQTLLTGKVRLV
jgi:restriction endonuclease S subunit